MKIAKLNIEGYIGGSDIQAMFTGEETFNLSKLKKFLDSLESDVTDIHVFINSGGGSIVEGWAIYDKLKTSGKTITTIGEGMVGSIATVIYMAGSVRKLNENTRFFIHNPYWVANAETPLEGNDLIALGEDLKSEQSKILNFYSSKTGIESNVIEPLMDRATDLTADQAIEMGFAHSKINEFVNHNHYKLVALINKPKQEKQMEDKNQILSAIDKLGILLNKVFKGKQLNMTMPVKTAEGVEVELIIESETEDITGKPAFVKNEQGENVPASNGEYTDSNGKVIKVVDGMVSEVMEAKAATEVEDIEAIKAELANALAVNAELKASIENHKTENDTIKNSLNEINTEFVALKKTIIGSGAKFETGLTQNFNNTKVIEENSFISELTKSIKNKKQK